MFLESQMADFIVAIVGHLMPGQVRNLACVCKAALDKVTDSLTESLRKTCLELAVATYTKSVHFSRLVGVFDVYTMHGKTRARIYAGQHTLLEARFPKILIDFNGVRCEFRRVHQPFLENGIKTDVFICHVDKLVRSRVVVGMWIRDIVVGEREIHFELVLERKELKQLTMSLACVK